MTTLDFEIKKLTTYQDLIDVQAIRSVVWPNDGDVAIDHMKFIVQHGGIVLGAFHLQQLVGYVYSFPGYQAGKAYLILQNIAVLPDYRHQKLGQALMHQVKAEAIQLGYNEMIWTFEPLSSINANVYFHKMGAVSTTYIPDCYLEDNHGTPTDRLLARWDLHDSPPTEVSLQHAYTIDPSMSELDQAMVNNASIVLLPIPAQLAHISVPTVKRWRMFTRNALTQLFKQSFEAYDFVDRHDSDTNYYILRKKGQT